jgi:hypothetical protein
VGGAAVSAREDPVAGVVFGVRHAQSVLFGQTWPQLAIETVGFAAALTALRAGSLAMTAAWLAVVAACAGVAWIPVRGRNVVEYLPVYAGWWLRLVTGHDLYLGGPYRMSAQETGLEAPRLPGELADLAWQTYLVDDGGRTGRTEGGNEGDREPVAVLKDRRAGTFTAVLALQASTFALLEGGEQRRRIEAYGAMLDVLCREDSPVSRLQLLERTVPDSGTALHRDLATHGDPAAPGAAQAAYRQLIGAPAAFAQRHETFLALTLDPRRGSARERITAHGGGDAGSAAVLFQVLTQLAAGLEAAGVEVSGWLPPRGLAAVLRAAFDPAGAASVDRRSGGRGDEPGGDPGLPSGVDPQMVTMFAQPAFDHYRTDSGYHRTYWVMEWPRVEVPAGFLQPLLLNSRHRRTLSLVMEPIPPRKALRQVDIAESHLEGERRWRHKIGRRARHRDSQEAAANARRERELTAGYGTYRFLGLISVTAPSLPELELASGEVLSLAAQSRLECAPLIHQQDQAFFAAALPLARGLA